MKKPVEIVRMGPVWALSSLLAKINQSGTSLGDAGAERIVPQSSSAPAPPSPTAPAPPSLTAPAPSAPASGETPEQRITRVRERLRHLRDDERRRLIGKVLDGEAFARPGARDRELNRVCAIIAYLEPALEPHEIVAMLAPSLQAMQREADDANNPAPTEQDALDKATRKLAQSRRRRDRELEINERIRRVLVRDARASITLANDDEDAPEEDEEEIEVGFYTNAELDSFALLQNCSPEEFSRRWIISHMNANYVFVNGKYQSPVVKDDLSLSLVRDLAPVPETGHHAAISRTKLVNGIAREKTAAEILHDHGTAARRVVCDLTIAESYYDPATQTFREAVGALRPICPRFNPDIDAWLHLLGGKEADKLLDWIATLTRLDRQTCAVYLSGPASVGKTLLAYGLSRLWKEEGGPTQLNKILDNFNGDLLKCPLIFADEKIPHRFGSSPDSSTIRELIGSSSRALSRKYLPNTDLVGAVRLIMAANNEDLLSFDESLSPDDIEAISKRFLHIATTEEPMKFLQGLGGQSGSIGSWVQGDAIAAHALWLRDNRQVVPGDRFLVEGRRTRLHNNLPTSSKQAGLVCEWLVKLLNAPAEKRKSVEMQATVLIGEGKLLVNAEALSNNWSLFVTSDPTPSIGRLGRVLKTLSTQSIRINDHRFHEINLPLVLTWADTNLIGKPDTMAKLISRASEDAEYEAFRRRLSFSLLP